MEKFRTGKLGEEEKIELEKTFKEIEASPLIINDSFNPLIDDICRQAMDAVENGPTETIKVGFRRECCCFLETE